MRKTVVLGAGESGTGVSLLAKKHGCEVFVSDSGRIKDKYKDMMRAHGIDWEEGFHSEDRILSADEVVKSPGVPDTSAIMTKIVDKGIPVLSEIEFCYRYLRGKTICITGSNGKNTTATLVYRIMLQSGASVALGGNIGRSLAMQLSEGDKEWYVVELSSFQLDNCYDFHANVAVVMNITPDHLDRYDFKMQHYVDSKMRIMQNQKPDDVFIYWSGDGYIGKEVERRLSGAVVPGPVPSSREAMLGNPLLCPFCDDDFDRLGLEISLPGNHNKRNALAAYYAAKAAGVEEEVIRRVLKEFEGVEHRIEYVASKYGVDYINDSKATNVDACRVALEAMNRPTVLIVGGTDKGNDYMCLYPLIKEKCRAIVFLGADNARLHGWFDMLGLPTADTHSMKDCVFACQKLAKEGD